MIPYNVEVQLEGDINRCGNYITVNYEFPFPEDSILAERDQEAKRIQQSFVNNVKQSLINNNK